MRGVVIFLCLLSLLPLGMAGGYDVWRYYEAYQEDSQKAEFSLSSVGYLWLAHARDLHDVVVEEVGEEVWGTHVVPFLRMKAVYLFAVPAVVVNGLVGLLWMFGIAPFHRVRSANKTGKSGSSFGRGNERARARPVYKRK